jgi:hypothetical protein
LFEEVQKFTCVTSSSTRPEVAVVASASNEDKENDDDPWEEERSWRDPSAHSLRSVVIDWDDIQSTRRMRVSFYFILNLGSFFNILSRIKNILTPNHTSTSFWSPSANVRYWRKNITENWCLIFSPWPRPRPAPHPSRNSRSKSWQLGLLSFPNSPTLNPYTPLLLCIPFTSTCSLTRIVLCNPQRLHACSLTGCLL